MGEFNEQLAQTGNLHKGFDYIALGHYHENVEVTENAAYAGSTERLGFGEVGHKKGVLTIDLEKGKRKFHKLESRNMTDVGPINCARKSVEQISNEIESRLSKLETKDHILRVKLKGISSNDYHLLDMTGLRKQVKSALHSEFKIEFSSDTQTVASGDLVFESLESEFAGYIAKTAIEGTDKKALKWNEITLPLTEELSQVQAC
jgi:DNA repair exonuclease SbcCD nuclease subunit